MKIATAFLAATFAVGLSLAGASLAAAEPGCDIAGANAWCEPMPGTPLGDYLAELDGKSPAQAYLESIEYPGGPPYRYGDTVEARTSVPVADASIACTQLRAGWGSANVIDSMIERAAVASRTGGADIIMRMVRPLCFDQIANIHDQMGRPDLVAMDPLWTHRWIHAPGSLTQRPG